MRGGDGSGRRASGRDSPTRRDFLQAGIGSLAAGAVTLALPACAPGGPPAAVVPSAGRDDAFVRAARPALAELQRLAAIDAANGGTAPAAIPWLDKNGSFNQSPGPGQEPSSIFHFRGHVARANAFTGMGTDNAGRRIPFGTGTTDFSFMQGAYWAAREEREGAFAHT